MKFIKKIYLYLKYTILRYLAKRRYDKCPHQYRVYRIVGTNIPSFRNLVFRGTPERYIQKDIIGTRTNLAMFPESIMADSEDNDRIAIIGKYQQQFIIKRIDNGNSRRHISSS